MEEGLEQFRKPKHTITEEDSVLEDLFEECTDTCIDLGDNVNMMRADDVVLASALAQTILTIISKPGLTENRAEVVLKLASIREMYRGV